jgi:hypothetical protein
MLTQEQIETYNYVARYINDNLPSNTAANQTDPVGAVEELGGGDRIPCLMFINGGVVKINCKTGEIIP